eukprot:TRINITY_DN3345_c0_g2_i1.p1 TRINITY_DN3345_c0_g2~~TRINITY_DN3345_c0_g2_i1.p1  ORF type:complete len:283 (-),score=75.09 TRINITY_DN3345_c0_g2_i1:211-1059(-)
MISNSAGGERERKRLYYVRNRDLIREKQRGYWERNKETIRERSRLYGENNWENIRTYQRLYRMRRKVLLRVTNRRNRKWTIPSQLFEFLRISGVLLFVRSPLDWYRISRNQLKQVGGSGLIDVFGGIGRVLEFVYPEVGWDRKRFLARGKKSTQRWLRVMLEEILPQNTLILEDFLHPALLWDQNSHHKMELDIWVPQYSLALEYQGEQHYYHNCFFGSTETLVRRDKKKRKRCEENGISLLIIPYWWDQTKTSLASHLHHRRPDIPLRAPPPLPISPPRKD